MQVLRGIEPPHVPLQPWLPANGGAAERLRVANVARAPELADTQRRVGVFPERKPAGGPESGGRDSVVTAEDCQGFDAIADGVAQLTRLGRCNLRVRAKRQQTDEGKAYCSDRARAGRRRANSRVTHRF